MAIAQEYADVVAVRVGCDEIGNRVAVEVSRGHGNGTRARREGDGVLEAALAVDLPRLLYQFLC